MDIKSLLSELSDIAPGGADIHNGISTARTVFAVINQQVPNRGIVDGFIEEMGSFLAIRVAGPTGDEFERCLRFRWLERQWLSLRKAVPEVAIGFTAVGLLSRSVKLISDDWLRYDGTVLVVGSPASDLMRDELESFASRIVAFRRAMFDADGYLVAR